MKVKDIKELQSSLINSDALRADFEKDPMTFLNQIEQIAPIKIKGVFLTVIYIVGAALLISVILAAIMVFQGKEVDEFFVMIASASIGALAGLLVPNPPN